MPVRFASGSKQRKAGGVKRTLRLHASFLPPSGPVRRDWDDFAEFQHFFAEARELRTRRKLKELQAKERKQREFTTKATPVAKILNAYCAGKITCETAARRLARACPDRELLRELLDWFAEPPSPSKKTDEELAAEEKALARSRKISRAWGQAAKAVKVLTEYASRGDEDAIKDLASIAETAALTLMMVERIHPEATRKVARRSPFWPLLAHQDKGWERSALQRVEKLELGKDLEFFRTPFRAARGADDNYPARIWAKVAVRALEETRWRTVVLGQYADEFKELILEGGVGLHHEPEWVKAACQLPVFSENSAREWGAVIRDMIREQAPDFHEAPEWAAQRNSARHNSRDTRGEIQNAILDDIVSALRRLAPPGKVPKSGS